MSTRNDDEGTALVLGDLLNRVLDKGVAISGHVLISVADIDLIALDLKLLLSSIESTRSRAPADAHPPLLSPPDKP